MTTRLWIALMVSLPLLTSASIVQASEPCCAITNIAGSLVTANETASGKTFQFQVNDRAALKSLRVGQKVHADFTTMKVSVRPDGAEPCCAIVSAAGGPAGTAKLPAVKLPTIHGAEPCCSVVANAALKGRLGRLTVAYPGNAKNIEARTDVYKAGNSKSIAGGYGNQAIELLPGTYDVVINGKRVTDVTVKSGHETQVKVGVLHVHAAKDTRVDILDAATSQSMTGGYGETAFGFPVGSVNVKISGQSETVTIEEGKVTEF